MNEDTLKDDNEKIRYYTGLTNWYAFFVLSISYVQPYLVSRKSLSPFQQPLLTLILIRLRLALPLQDLRYRFGIHPSTVSRIIAMLQHGKCLTNSSCTVAVCSKNFATFQGYYPWSQWLFIQLLGVVHLMRSEHSFTHAVHESLLFKNGL